jgi:hypothetical protein
MPLIFSDFYKLDQLAELRIGGDFSTSWDGSYRADANGNGKEPNLGSGLTSGALPMRDVNELPAQVQALLQCRGLIYIFVSTKYPILYVGITQSDLKTGVFGPGRFAHHARKLLAVRGSGTNHTGGWTEHAVQRYRDFVNDPVQGVATFEQMATHLSDDWRFAFGSCNSPKQHEGFVLDQMADKFRNVIILNTGALRRVPIDVQLPPNLGTVIGQIATQGETPLVEDSTEPPTLNIGQVKRLPIDVQRPPDFAQTAAQGETPTVQVRTQPAILKQRVAHDTAEEKFYRAMDPLGGEEHIDGIDPGEGVEDPDKWDEELDRTLSRSRVPSSRGGEWTVLPSRWGDGCSENLMVVIRNSSEILRLLDRTVVHLGRCDGVKVVVFHIGGDIGYVKWMRALLVNLPVMQSLSPGTRFMTRLARSWTPRAGQFAFWTGAIGDGTSSNGSNYHVPHRSRAVFKHRIWLLEELGLLKHDFGFIANHGNQPTQPSYGSDLSFGTMGGANITDWETRLYFGDSLSRLPLGFSERLLRRDAPPVISINGAWIAKDRSAFFMNPYAWISQATLDDCRHGA